MKEYEVTLDDLLAHFDRRRKALANSALPTSQSEKATLTKIYGKSIIQFQYKGRIFQISEDKCGGGE